MNLIHEDAVGKAKQVAQLMDSMAAMKPLKEALLGLHRAHATVCRVAVPVDDAAVPVVDSELLSARTSLFVAARDTSVCTADTGSSVSCKGRNDKGAPGTA